MRTIVRSLQMLCMHPYIYDLNLMVVRTLVNCCQVTLIWCAADPNFITTPVFILSLGSVAGIFGMLEIITGVWLMVEDLYE